VEAAGDRVAIQELVYRYSDAVTRGDWDAIAGLLTADAVWESPALRLHFEGPEPFLDFLRSTIAEDSVLIQTAHGSVIDFTGPDAASATTTINELARTSTLNAELHGVFFDELARSADGWKFTHKLFVPIYTEVGALTGALVTPRPVLRPS
jgi:ketosteroid isomerase-like protein